MKKLLLVLLAFCSFAAATEAQIFKISFKDEKAAKKYKKYTTEVGGQKVVLCEAIPGGGIKLEDGTINYRGPQGMRGDSTNSVWVLDPKDPSKIPYEVKNGEKKTKIGKMVARIDGNYIDKVEVFMRTEDIASLAREYRFRVDRIDRRQAKRDEYEKGTVPWFHHHQILVTEYERLISWLESIVFTPAAKKISKRLDKEMKVVAQAARQQRIEKSLESITDVETPENLTEVSADLTGGQAKFKVQESQHLRIVYLEEIGDQRVEGLLTLAEQIIDGFRVEFVDPYLSEEFKDNIPDERFAEFFFGPEDVGHYEKFFVNFYGQQWGEKDKERRLEMSGTSAIQRVGPTFLNYHKMKEQTDLEGIVSHRLGHMLAQIHFNGGHHSFQQDWLTEGLAYYISFEYFGRNTVTCFSFQETEYAKPDKEEGEKTVQRGLRQLFNQIALDAGPRFDKLTLKRLVDFEDPDLAKAWSIVDYVCKELGIEGQRWLRACCEFARDTSSFHEKWRATSEEIFDVTGKDVFRMMDERWREYAESLQDTSEDGKG